MDWLAMVLLCGGWGLTPWRRRAGTGLIVVSDVAWTWYAIVTDQLPLLIVSAFCGAMAFWSLCRDA